MVTFDVKLLNLADIKLFAVLFVGKIGIIMNTSEGDVFTT